MAGKIDKNCWRHRIVRDLRCLQWSDAPLRDAVEISGEKFDYTGPFFMGCDHGCTHDSSEGTSHHTAVSFCGGALWDKNEISYWLMGEELFEDHEKAPDANYSRRSVAKACIYAVQSSDLVFAWIDSNECHGTLVEIGVALDQTTLLVGYASEKLKKELWFPGAVADAVIVHDDPVLALHELLHSQVS